METPPSYQEATAKKKNWFKRIVRKLFGKTAPQPGFLVERKLIHPFRNEFDTTLPSSSKCGKLIPRPSSVHAQAAIGGYRNSIHHTPDQPPTNYVRIKRNNAPIIGIWNIDTSLHVPEHLLVPFKDKSEARHHLHLWSSNQSIDAVVNVVEPVGGEKNVNDVVLLTASSLGNVSLRVTKPLQRTLSIFVRGSLIKVFIPRSYKGTLKAHTATGSVFFSNEVAQRLRTVYEKGHESRHFIGDMEGHATVQDEDEGKYDVMKLKAKTRTGEKYGEVYIAYEDEEEVFLA